MNKIIVKYLYRFLNQIYLLPKFIGDYYKFLVKDNRFNNSIFDTYPCLTDGTETTGYEPHYTYHLAWAIRKIELTKPKLHVDISSSLNFAVSASAIVPVKFYDYRPAKINLSNLKTYFADLNNLPFKSNSVKSLSCMHVIEHIGLGRYGDDIDVDGDIKAVAELKRVLSVDGNLFFVVPVGKSRLRYNAHRIYSLGQIKNLFSDMKLVEFSFLSDDYSKGFKLNPSSKYCDTQKWGMGCFWFKKI